MDNRIMIAVRSKDICNPIKMEIGLHIITDELNPSIWRIELEPQLLGHTMPTWNELIWILYSTYEEGHTTSIGEELEALGQKAHEEARHGYWRLDIYKGMSGCRNFRIMEVDHKTWTWGLNGKCSGRLYLSMNDKPAPFQIRLMDWYVFLKMIPSFSWEELENQFSERFTISLLEKRSHKWYEEGACPWEESK